jgi:F-type H+-transporting ATPase subunit gamma
MSDTLENLQRRKESAGELSSVVRTMKALAASNIGQYEMAVKSLRDYYRTVSLGIYAALSSRDTDNKGTLAAIKDKEQKKYSVAVVFGSDQGLVGRFNDIIAIYMQQVLRDIPGTKEIWVVGERMLPVLSGANLMIGKNFAVPNSVDGITPLVNRILLTAEDYREKKQMDALYIFHNIPYDAEGYHPAGEQLLPLDDKWKRELPITEWPEKTHPEAIGGSDNLLASLLREYLFVILYKACAESLVSENSSRLEAMQRAEKNIGETMDDLNQRYNRLRQSTIDEELFDVVSGFEALKQKTDK